MTTPEAMFLTLVIVVYLLLMAAIAWGTLQTRGLERPPINHDHTPTP